MVINKKLLADIANQIKLLHVTNSVDVSNYFDRVTYLFVGMVFQYFGLLVDFVISFFNTIQEIRMYLITVFRTSTQFYIGLVEEQFQGLL